MTKKRIRRSTEGNNKTHKTMPSSTLGFVRTRQMYAKPDTFLVDQSSIEADHPRLCLFGHFKDIVSIVDNSFKSIFEHSAT